MIPQDDLQKMYDMVNKLFPVQSQWQHDQNALLSNKNLSNVDLRDLYEVYRQEINQRRTDLLDGITNGYSLALEEIARLKELIYKVYKDAMSITKTIWDGTDIEAEWEQFKTEHKL